MKAAIFHALGQPLAIEDRPDPAPGEGEVVVKVCRCGICGSDLHMTQEADFAVAPGSILGHEFSGEVMALGRGVENLRVGDHVAVSPVRGCGACDACRAGKPAWCENMMLQGGGYADFATAAARQCVRMPSTTTLADGALVEPLAVALHGVALSPIQPGARVLVMGAGPIGLGAAFWARRLGAGRVAVLDLTTLQQDLAHQLGATGFVTAGDDSAARIRKELGGMPDIIFECVGRPGILAQAIQHVRPRGTIVMLGLCTTEDSFVPFHAVSKEVKIVTSAFFHESEYEAALDALDGGKASPTAMVTETVSLADMPQTFEALRKRTHQCKVMVQPG